MLYRGSVKPIKKGTEMKHKYFVYDPEINTFETFATMDEAHEYFEDIKKEYTTPSGIHWSGLDHILIGQFTHKTMRGEDDSMNEVVFLEQIK